MKLGALVLKLRDAETSFALVGGAAEYAWARESTLKKEAAFIIPLQDTASPNQTDTEIIQTITEQFAVVAAIKNSTEFEDKTGFSAYNRVHDIRTEIFNAFLGLDIGRVYGQAEGFMSESLIYYKGGQLLDMDRAFMWYQFTFEYQMTVGSFVHEEADGFFDKIWVDYVLQPSDDLPISEHLPIDAFAPDMTQYIDLSAEEEDYEE